MTRRRLARFWRLDDGDPWLLASVGALCLLGTLAVFGAGSFRPEAQAGSLGQFYYLVKHVIRLSIGLVALCALGRVDLNLARRPPVAWSALAVALVLTAVPVVGKQAGIERWISVFGLFPVQPLEVAKLAVIWFLAVRLSAPAVTRPLAGLNLARTLAAGPLALIVILILQPNFGNVVVVALTTLLVLFVAGLGWRWLLPLVPASGVAAWLGFLAVSKLQTRILAWWQGWRGLGVGEEPPFGYQVHQSLIGLGAGGWHGLGPGNSHNKFAFLPEQHTDFAFSYLGEELGLVGTVIVTVALSIFVWRALAIAQRAPDTFGRLLAAGLGGMIFVYGFANIAMVTGVIPVMGVPLPFVSYGGSALVSNLAAVGLLLNVDRQARSYQRWRRNWLPGGR